MAEASEYPDHKKKLLSVLIAAYGDDVSPLLEGLQSCLEFGLPDTWEVEILISDQFDQPHPLAEEWNTQPKTTYIHSQSKGRSTNRNELAERSNGHYLLFLDADALPKTSGFLNRYCNYAEGAQVIVGGTAYMPGHESDKLRVKIGRIKEEIAPSVREQHPYSSFSAFNFLIRREVFERVAFDRSITKYGHEDTLFGRALKHHCIDVMHIDNSAYHMGIDDDDVFMEKTKDAVDGLANLIDLGKIDEDVQLYKYYRYATKAKLTGVLRMLYNLFGKAIKNRLGNGKGPIFLFDVYKLLRLSSFRLKLQYKKPLG